MFRVITFFLFVVSSIYADDSPALRGDNPYCIDPPTDESGCGISLKYPLQMLFNPRPVISYCGYPGFEVDCSAKYGRRVAINISDNIYHVLDVKYEWSLKSGKMSAGQIRLVDMEADGHDCPQPMQNFSLPSSSSWVNYNLSEHDTVTIFYNCSDVPVNAKAHLFCSQDYYKTSNTPPSYAVYKSEIPKGLDWYTNCAENVVVPVDTFYNGDTNFTYRDAVKSGFYMAWFPTGWCKDCELSGGMCWSTLQYPTACYCREHMKSYTRSCPLPSPPKPGMHTGLKITICVFPGMGGLFLLLVLITYIRNRRNKNKRPFDTKAFLERYGGHALKTYKYLDIKMMTNSFRYKLGQGGYGQVFKGKLHDGRLVAVKVLNGTKGNGEDFINEVAAIGRTNHVNIVTLMGFCIEGTKRALVYEFMPNGSLERFIYSHNKSAAASHLGWEKLYEIALGIAKGLEYLHSGCNTRILHFDIKPHNILLDQDFCPKISDFGLAKLYPTRESVVSTVGARGTMGYIAPELCCRNFGNVSHKSDVYSYGMMMLEMIGGRNNIDATVENISEIYFPFWVYNHLTQNNDTTNLEDIHVREIFEDKTAKKMIIVALWCIQPHPMERPSMNKVVEMLEGNIQDLEIPSNPSPDPRSSSTIL